MFMNRRKFLQSLAAGIIASHELDIDRLLWVPGQKKIFLPESPKIYQSIEPWIEARILQQTDSAGNPRDRWFVNFWVNGYSEYYDTFTEAVNAARRSVPRQTR
jgi:hypothetical protein